MHDCHITVIRVLNFDLKFAHKSIFYYAFILINSSDSDENSYISNGVTLYNNFISISCTCRKFKNVPTNIIFFNSVDKYLACFLVRIGDEGWLYFSDPITLTLVTSRTCNIFHPYFSWNLIATIFIWSDSQSSIFCLYKSCWKYSGIAYPHEIILSRAPNMPFIYTIGFAVLYIWATKDGLEITLYDYGK